LRIGGFGERFQDWRIGGFGERFQDLRILEVGGF
jgi:hypothetical protein